MKLMECDTHGRGMGAVWVQYGKGMAKEWVRDIGRYGAKQRKTKRNRTVYKEIQRITKKYKDATGYNWV